MKVYIASRTLVTKKNRNMSCRRLSVAATMFAVALVLSACRSKAPSIQETTGPPLPEPAVPPGYQKIPPKPVDDAVQMLSQTATIFRGSLKSVRFTFDGCAGPRTVYVFSDASPLVGTRVESEVPLKVLGGPTPSGTWVGVSEIPQLALDSQYVVFLRNTDWTFNPIVGNLVFRVEMIGGREMLVDPSGRAVTGWGDNGPVLSAGTVSEVVGNRRRGFKSADAPAAADQPNSATTDPRPQAGAGGSATSIPGRPEDSPFDRAPSVADARKAGLFARPALTESAIGNEQTVTVDTFVAAVRAAADRAQVNIGGRLVLDPNWRCWSSTPTSRAAR